jgi:hypothetical protein
MGSCGGRSSREKGISGHGGSKTGETAVASDTDMDNRQRGSGGGVMRGTVGEEVARGGKRGQRWALGPFWSRRGSESQWGGLRGGFEIGEE